MSIKKLNEKRRRFTTDQEIALIAVGGTAAIVAMIGAAIGIVKCEAKLADNALIKLNSLETCEHYSSLKAGIF